ncbi:hypothetical protein Pelo_502 [Pelomyxa schiedti]|nr:hypothetical protein Pelo_502 [Pelomyxa schiedti]
MMNRKPQQQNTTDTSTSTSTGAKIGGTLEAVFDACIHDDVDTIVSLFGNRHNPAQSPQPHHHNNQQTVDVQSCAVRVISDHITDSFFGHTTFHVACNNGSVKVVEFLLSQQCQVNKLDPEEHTGLWMACANQFLPVVSVLLRVPGIDVNTSNPLAVACERGNIQIVRLLLAHKNIKVNNADADGKTPLYTAAKKGLTEIVALLLSMGGEYIEETSEASEQRQQRALKQSPQRETEQNQREISDLRREYEEQIANLKADFTVQMETKKHDNDVLQNELEQQRTGAIQQIEALNQEHHEQTTVLNEMLAATKMQLQLSQSKHLEEIYSKFEKRNLGTIGMDDLDISQARYLGKGSDGCVSRVPVLDTFHIPGQGEEVALKMLYNYSAGNSSVALKRWFSREYRISIQFPHWSLCNTYNYFHSKTLLSLVPPEIRPQHAILDGQHHFLEGYNSSDAVPLFSRTTYVSQELGIGDAAVFLSYRLNGIPRAPMQPVLTSNPLTDQGILELAFCMLCACTHLNGNNCYHGDIKLNNILAVQRPRLQGFLWVLSDFGTVNECDSQGFLPPDQTLDSPQCIRSPEVNKPQSASHTLCLAKNDVWAAGCAVYELITGMHPFYSSDGRFDSNSITDLSLGPQQVPQSHRDHILSPLVGYLLERDHHTRPSAKEAMLVCGALIFLPAANCSSFLVPVPTHKSVQQAIELYADTKGVSSILWFVHNSNVARISEVERTRGQQIMTREFLSLVFTNAALSDVDFFCATMVKFLKRLHSLLP